MKNHLKNHLAMAYVSREQWVNSKQLEIKFEKRQLNRTHRFNKYLLAISIWEYSFLFLFHCWHQFNSIGVGYPFEQSIISNDFSTVVCWMNGTSTVIFMMAYRCSCSPSRCINHLLYANVHAKWLDYKCIMIIIEFKVFTVYGFQRISLYRTHTHTHSLPLCVLSLIIVKP